MTETVPKCARCGFAVGERVKMISGFDGALLCGTVKDWPLGGCGHLVEWDDRPWAATGLPNPHVWLETSES